MGISKRARFLTKPNTIVELKESITQKIAAISADMVRTSVYGIEESLLPFQEESSGHIQHFCLYKQVVLLLKLLNVDKNLKV